MARTTPKGLHVWDLEADPFNHTQLAANWDLIDSLLGTPATSIQTLAAVPSSGNFAGRTVMLSAANSGFPAWQLIRFDGSAWRAIGYEILPAVPTVGNFAGRIVVLSAANGGFNAWDMIKYDGSAWNIVGGFLNINNGGGATNIRGLQTPLDVFISDSARGFVVKDRSTGTNYRLTIVSGTLGLEVVT
jgi:hypothetical protein